MTMDPYSYASSHSNRATFMDGILSTPCSSFCFNSHISSLFTSIPPMPKITFYLCIRPTILISGFVVDLGYFEMVVSSCTPFLQYMDKQFCPHTQHLNQKTTSGSASLILVCMQALCRSSLLSRMRSRRVEMLLCFLASSNLAVASSDVSFWHPKSHAFFVHSPVPLGKTSFYG